MGLVHSQRSKSRMRVCSYQEGPSEWRRRPAGAGAGRRCCGRIGSVPVAGQLLMFVLLLLLLPSFSEAGVARIIHRFYSGGQRAMRSAANEPTSSFKLYWIKSCETHHPGWDIRYWDDRSVLALIRRDYPFFLPTFKSYRQVVQRSDAARWLILYKYGGVYIDNDVECYRSMEPSLQGLDLALNCELEAPPGKVGNAVVASAPGHPVWPLIMREGMKRAASVRPGANVAETLDVTGPHLTEWGIKTLHNLTMDAELCGVTLTGPGGRKAYAHRMGEWFTPCRWNNNTCHMEWARKSFHIRRDAAATAAGTQTAADRGAVVGRHMYASSWTDEVSAVALRMRGEARESFDEASKFLSNATVFEEYTCLEPIYESAPPTPNAAADSPAPPSSQEPQQKTDQQQPDQPRRRRRMQQQGQQEHPLPPQPVGQTEKQQAAAAAAGQGPKQQHGRLLACGEFVDDAVAGGSCSLVTMAGSPDTVDLVVEATLRRRGCRATVFSPGGGLPGALGEQQRPGAAPAPPPAAAHHIRAYVGPVTALLSDPPVLSLLQAMRMAAAAARNGAGGRVVRNALEVDDDESEPATPDAALLASAAAAAGPGRMAPPRHTLLHIACGGCEWDTFHALFQHATLAGDALDFVETLLLDTPGPVPSDHRALSMYALLYQVHGFVGFTHQRLPNGQIRLGWVRAPWRAAVRAAVLAKARRS